MPDADSLSLLAAGSRCFGPLAAADADDSDDDDDCLSVLNRHSKSGSGKGSGGGRGGDRRLLDALTEPLGCCFCFLDESCRWFCVESPPPPPDRSDESLLQPDVMRSVGDSRLESGFGENEEKSLPAEEVS